MQRLDYGQGLETETHEFSSDGLREVEAPGPVIRVHGSVALLLENQQEVKWISDAASIALASSASIEEQEERFLEILSQLPDQPPTPLDADQMERVLSSALESKRDLTPLETLVAGSEGLAALMENPGFGYIGVGVVFVWRNERDRRECGVEAHDELPMFILEHGSLLAALGTLKGFYATGKWMLAAYGWVRPKFTRAPEAAAWFVEQLRARAMTQGHGAIPLDRLDHPNTILTYDPQRHPMAIVYVHGLFSTDAKTFDGFATLGRSFELNFTPTVA